LGNQPSHSETELIYTANGFCRCHDNNAN